jgi:transposase InsO family protein
VILRLRLEHPRWGPNRIRAKLKQRPALKGLRLPSDASIGRYLHQWSCFRRPPRQEPKGQRPKQPSEVHQCWQLDFKLGVVIAGGDCLVNLHTLCDPVGEACMGAFVFPAGQAGRKPQRPSFEQARSVLRACFAHWHTLPDQVQTDGEPTLIGKPQDTFPSPFTLWLAGLGIQHLVIRPGKPTDNAEVERWHRTINDYAIRGNERVDAPHLQHILDQAVHELDYELSSNAEDCHGLPPIAAHPELLQPRRAFRPEHELALFDLRRVDAYLATFTWKRHLGKNGQLTIGGRHHRYSVGRPYAGKDMFVRFDPTDRHFVFYDVDYPETEIGRRPAKHLDVIDLTGLAAWPTGLGIQQLPLPLLFPQGVGC